MADDLPDWRDDPSSDECWNAGCDFAITQLAAVLGIDPNSFSWDAATEELEGDVRAVIGNALAAGLGDDWRKIERLRAAVSELEESVNGLEAERQDLNIAIAAAEARAEKAERERVAAREALRLDKTDGTSAVTVIRRALGRVQELREAYPSEDAYMHGTVSILGSEALDDDIEGLEFLLESLAALTPAHTEKED